MITHELLEAKYQAQRILTEQGGQDLRSYVQHVHQVVQHTEHKYGLKFRYGRIKRKGAISPKAALRGPSLAQTRQVAGRRLVDNCIVPISAVPSAATARRPNLFFYSR